MRETPKIRLFVDADLAADTHVAPTDGQRHYLAQVMRLRTDDHVALFNGRDGEWRARVLSLDKRGPALVVEDSLRQQVAEPDLWLAFAPIKRAPVDFLAQKATELGVARLVPVMTQHTDVRRLNTRRLQANAVEAAEQCGRLTVPTVAEPLPLDDLINDWPPTRRLFVLDETGGGAPIAEALFVADTKTAGFLVGPEGGFARSELDALRDLPFVTAVDLGKRILRADTAAIAALSCWQALVGDWRHAHDAT
jgi:16S rRNA (uracil1498-N3)-methyltransferase